MMYPYPQTFNHQRPANSYTCHYHPCFESMPPKTNHPSHFAHLPCPNPAEHYYSPGYYSYPHIQPPPQPYYHAPYPSCPDAYLAYFVPPPHYSFDQPRYDYDKARHHCCGCPNHMCHPKIEENKHEKEREGDSKGLVNPQNYPYPVVWVPSNFMKDKENWNGWVPLDMNTLKGSRQEGEEKKQSPRPVIWMSGYDKPEEPAKELKEINPAPKAVEEWPSGFKIVPLKLLQNVDEDKNPRAVKDEPKSRVQLEEPVEKESRTKTIPVTKLEEKNEKKTSVSEKPKEEKADENRHITSEKQKEDDEVKKASEKKQASTVKSPKLPPVCLRVDPLPRRKKTNGTSRSPSPPGLKGEGSPRENGEKETRGLGETSKRKDIPVTHIKDSPSSQGGREQICPDNLAAASSKKHDSMKEKCAQGKRMIDVNNGDAEDPESENKKEKKEKKSLSELDAALTIQSAFRGFEVRKWQPLEKLRKIARIREQVGCIRKQIENIEGLTKQNDSKQRMVISETIMNLLLQLDTIQGLHPNVREARKSVARELTCLQEKLDSLSSLVNVEHEAVKVEKNLSDKTSDCGDVCNVISSSVEAKPSTEQESLEMIGSIGCTGAGELAKIEENSKDEAPDVEGACDVSPSVEPTSELKFMQPADVNSAAEQPSSETEESNRSADESVIYMKIPPLVTEPTSEEKLDWVTGGDQIGGQPALEENVAESLKERDEGRAHEVEVVETAVKELDEPVLSSIEAPVESEIMSSDLRNKGWSANLACMEEVLHLSHVNASPDETALKESSQVISQECKKEVEEMVASEASDNTNHEPQKPSVQLSEEENNIVAALVRDEEHTLDIEKSAVTTPGEDSIDPDKISSLELQKDALAEEEKPQMLSVADGNCQIEMSKEVEGVAGMSTDVSCPKQALDGDKDIGTVVENPEMLVTGQGIISPEPPTVDVLLSTATGTPQCGDFISEVAKSLDLKEEMNTVVPDGISLSGPETTIKQSEAKYGTEEKKLIEENGKLKEMLEKLLEEGKDQLGIINQLNGRVKDLERKLTQKKRVKVRRNRPPKVHSRGILC